MLAVVLFERIVLNVSLHADKTNLWAETCFWSLLTSVTSKNVVSFLSLAKELDAFFSNSFHFYNQSYLNSMINFIYALHLSHK